MVNPQPALVVTGVSGSGKSTAAKALEDIGYYCVDNLPTALLPALLELSVGAPDVTRVAVVLDVRSWGLGDESNAVLPALRAAGRPLEVLFLDAQDEMLVRRFSETRRRHPLLRDGLSVIDAIRQERLRLAPLRAEATLVVDTSLLTVHDLRKLIAERFGHRSALQPAVTVMSFGYKYGIPSEADYVFDVRFLPNPHFVDELRYQSGRDEEVRAFLEQYDEVQKLLLRIQDLLDFVFPYHDNEGRVQLTVAVGCTGGRHRSVYCAERLAATLDQPSRRVRVYHRDIERT